MAPFLDERIGEVNRVTSQPRLLIIGAGSRGNAYARAVTDSGLGVLAGVVEPIAFKRAQLGSKYIWHDNKSADGQEFEHWRDFITYEQQRRNEEANGAVVPSGVDGVFICVKDDLHVDAVTDLAPLRLHIMCEKPLATTLTDCLRIQRVLNSEPSRIFAIGHVLRYSPHNMLLRQLVMEQKVIGDVLSMEHTEPVGWWHFSHSYVRGQWRKEKSSAPSLLTKSCHDIDFILWILCSPVSAGSGRPHFPSSVTSSGSLKQFTRRRKPKAAGDATNCLQCPIRDSCMYSAPRVYYDRRLAKDLPKWPVDIVNPEIPSILQTHGPEKAKEALYRSLAEDYDSTSTPVADIESRAWYGRCVWESDNDVCDDQFVTFTWEDEPASGYGAKTATFHMIAQTLAQCERRGRIYGTRGEVDYDSKSITVHDFSSNRTTTFNPEIPENSHHGGGDDGLTYQFVKAVAAVQEGKMDVAEAQVEFLGVTIEEVVRSHAAVFAADEARTQKKVIDWSQWWAKNVGEDSQSIS